MMSAAVKEKLLKSLDAAADRDVHLVLLAGGAGSGKSKILRELAGANGYRLIDVKLELSSRLAGLAPAEQAGRLESALDETIGHNPLALLDNTETLFSFGDPLPLLRKLAADRVLLVSWNGVYDGAKLSYQQLGREDQDYSVEGLLIVSTEGPSTLDA